jgi:hypothetical protein
MIKDDLLLEGVVVSVNYDDFLAWTLPLNKDIFNKLVVVTCEDDWNTANLCRHYDVECVKTNIFKDKDKFPKGKAINIGLDHLSRQGWICHLDSDIVLPARTRKILQMEKLNPNNIYTGMRMNCVGFDKWLPHFVKPKFIHEKEILVHLDAFPMSPLLSKSYVDDIDFFIEPGLIPIGYLQLWNDNGVPKKYPEGSNDCGTDDFFFPLKHYPLREQRRLIHELVCVHLVGEDGAGMCRNWTGRKSARFGPIGR